MLGTSCCGSGNWGLAERRRPRLRRCGGRGDERDGPPGDHRAAVWPPEESCRAWQIERSRSALYARRDSGGAPSRQGDVRRATRCPKPLLRRMSQLLAAIRADLARSPFQGAAGHRTRSTRGCRGSWMRIRRACAQTHCASA